ncbi:follicle-stimulating hormone receptor-like isoform X2 [Watersipora subatra]|uniref:follicle-stimulating hormone receptor-like isoform X2 n=1 Tax=Watersipora subatra TaxID=2589382 RepID=UPI00355C0B69
MSCYLWLLLLPAALAQGQSSYKCGSCECEKVDRVTARCASADIRYVPQDLPKHTAFLHLMGTGITKITTSDFQRYKLLSHITIRMNQGLTTLEDRIFSENTHLSSVEISDNFLLSNVSQSAFDGNYQGIRCLDLSYNNLNSMPDLSRVINMNTTLAYHLILSGNPLRSPTRICPVRTQKSCILNSVRMTHTQMKYLPNFVFNGTQLGKLDLSNNTQLTGFDKNTFSLLVGNTLAELVLSDNEKLEKIPEEGISSVRILRCANCPRVTMIPPTIFYRDIQEVHLTYSQHCCAFRQPAIQDRQAYDKELEKEEWKCQNQEPAVALTSASINIALFPTSSTASTSSPDYQFITYGWGRKLLQFQDFIPTQFEERTTTSNPLFDNTKPTIDSQINHLILYERNCSTIDFEELRSNLTCTPVENSFIPCSNILEKANWLRAALWMVALLAIIGNLAVLTFTISSRSKSPMTVTKFLICNLAFSDTLQGIYLLTLAAVDIKTLGQYFNYATWWQKEGCNGVGFITIFSSELSVYTLSVITLERWYAISHAIHLTKRMQMKQAIIIMLVGWIFSAGVAVLPLVGFSGYQETSICLPFKYEDTGDKVYIWTLLVLNLGAFCLVLFCYLSIFVQVRGSNASMASDTYLARRMALLVMTDFLCWGPVAIVSALSAGGVNQHSSLWVSEEKLLMAKVILVIFYPFNACANPFLYAVFTKQFRKDCQQTLNCYGVCKRKIQGPRRRRLDDSVGSARQNLVRHYQSQVSNTTQLTNAYLSHTEQIKGSSIKSKESVEALVTCSLGGFVPHSSVRRDSAISIKDYAMGVLNNRTCPTTDALKKMQQGKAGVSQRTSISCSASTIDSLESTRISDPVHVPETLIEADSPHSEDECEPSQFLLNDDEPSKSQWHRNRWLSDARNKRYSEKSSDADSGTEVSPIEEWEAENCQERHHLRDIPLSSQEQVHLPSTPPSCQDQPLNTPSPSQEHLYHDSLTKGCSALDTCTCGMTQPAHPWNRVTCDNRSACNCSAQLCKLLQNTPENNNIDKNSQRADIEFSANRRQNKLHEMKDSLPAWAPLISKIDQPFNFD